MNECKILANGAQFTNAYNYSKITEDLPADLLNFSTPFVSLVMIRLKYIMLLKLPIILSSNSFYFNQLFPKLFPVQSIQLNH